MPKKRSKIELIEAGICPDCGGKLHFKNVQKKEALIQQGYTEIGDGIYEKTNCPGGAKQNPDEIARNTATQKEKKRSSDRWRARNLRLAETKRSKRNLKRSETLKRGGLKK